MKIKLIDEVYINEYYLNYLTNNDNEGLDYEERLNINLFLTVYKDMYKGNIYLDYINADSIFTKCKISGLYANCAIMKIFEVIK